MAGATALVLSARKVDFDTVRSSFESTCVQPKISFFDSWKVCSVPPGVYPNNGYGSGRINVEDAVTKVSTLQPTTTAMPGSIPVSAITTTTTVPTTSVETTTTAPTTTTTPTP